ncbi:MAG: glycine cleavage system protein R [Gammaproteobacteria bacterium]|nr:glycine cleavage system protein R [Gammaproteobacteria bacterium]|tara:strand:+ start:244 stop:768 length:525 start_codon:yes stop_codon:yes gene_type:complete
MRANQLVISFVGDDRPGIVQMLSSVVKEHEGNWLESRMSRLAGKFAGIVRIELPGEQLEQLKAALSAVSDISVLFEESENATEDPTSLGYSLNIIGPDRVGILQEVTSDLSRQDINVVDMETRVGAAPMTGDLTFYAQANVTAPHSIDLDELQRRLDATADELGVDILMEAGDS